MRLPAREEIAGRDRTDGCRGRRGRTAALCFSLSHSPSVKDVADDPFPSLSFFHTDINNTVINPPAPEWDSNGRLDLGLFLFSPLWLRPAVSETHKVVNLRDRVVFRQKYSGENKNSRQAFILHLEVRVFLLPG